MSPRITEYERPHTALVAGGTGALGAAVVGLLLDRGEQVCVPYQHEHGAQELRGRHADALDQGRLRLSECDVTDSDQLAAVLDVLTADWGPLWLACSTVGGWKGGQRVEELDDLSLLDLMLTLNLRSAVALAREGLRRMGPAGGRVVLVGALGAEAQGQAAYGAAKAGVAALVHTLAAELRGSGRTANAVAPRVIDTPANRRSMPDADTTRWVPPRAIAKVIAWLASADAWPVNGAVVPVGGD